MIAEKIVEKISNKFDKVEVYVEETATNEFELKNSKDFSKGMNIDKGCGIRIVQNNRAAFAYMSLSDGHNLDDIINDALSSIKFSKKLDAEIIYDSSYQYSRYKNIRIDEDKIKEKIYLMDKTARNFDKRIIDVKGAGISVLNKTFEIANNYGMCVNDAETYVSASVSVLAEDKIADAGWYSLDSNDFNSLDFEYTAERAADSAVGKLYPSSFSTRKYSVVFENRVFAQILSHFFSIFNAYSVINHTTALENSLGDTVFSDKITIDDEASLKNRPNDMMIDDEGAKRMGTRVVDRGVLKSFLHNTYTSDKLVQKNTSNAKRGSWMQSPKVGAFNLYIKPNSSISREQLINKIDGVYITEIMGLHMANNISGDFSLGISGFFIHNGKAVSYFKSATLADNFFVLMKRIIDVSDNMYFSSSFGSPDIAVADCVVGGED